MINEVYGILHFINIFLIIIISDEKSDLNGKNIFTITDMHIYHPFKHNKCYITRNSL